MIPEQTYGHPNPLFFQEIEPLLQEIYEDELSIALQRWWRHFTATERSAPDQLISRMVLRHLQFLCTDLLQQPLDETAQLCSDGNTYSPLTIECIQNIQQGAASPLANRMTFVPHPLLPRLIPLLSRWGLWQRDRGTSLQPDVPSSQQVAQRARQLLSQRRAARAAGSLSPVHMAYREIDRFFQRASGDLDAEAARQNRRLDEWGILTEEEFRELEREQAAIEEEFDRSDQRINLLVGRSEELLHGMEILYNRYREQAERQEVLLADQQLCANRIEFQRQLFARFLEEEILAIAMMEVDALEEGAPLPGDEVLEQIAQEEAASARFNEEAASFFERLAVLEADYDRIASELANCQAVVVRNAEELQKAAKDLNDCAIAIQQLAEKKARFKATVSSIAVIAGVALTGGALGLFEGGFSGLFGGAAAGTAGATTAITQGAGKFMLEFVAKQIITTGVSCFAEKTLGKISPLAATILRGVGGALTGNVSSMGDVLRDTAKNVILDRAHDVMRQIGGERLAALSQIVMSTASKDFKLLSGKGISAIAKSFAIDEVSRQVTKKMDPAFAPIVGTLIQGVGNAALQGLKGQELREHAKSTLFSMMGHAGSASVRDPHWRICISSSITRGLQEYSDEKSRIRIQKAEAATTQWKAIEDHRQEEEQELCEAIEEYQKSAFSDDVTVDTNTKEELHTQKREQEQLDEPWQLRRMVIQNPTPKENPIGGKKTESTSEERKAKSRFTGRSGKPKITSSAPLLDKMPKEKNFTLHYKDGFEYEFYPKEQKIVERTPSGEQYSVTKENAKEFERAYKKLAKIGGEIVKEDATLRIREPHSGPTLKQSRVFRLTAGPKTNNYEILFNNGIHYTPKEFKEALQLIHEYSGGNNVTGIYQDYGKFSQWGPHVSNTIGNRSIGGNSMLVSDFISFELSKNPNKQFLVVNHSMGGATAKGAMQNLTPCQQAQVSVIDLAPAGYSNEPGLRSNTAIVHGQDPVNQFDASGRKKMQKQGKLIDVTHKSSQHPKGQGSLFHHSFNDPVYKDDLKKEITSFVESCEKNKNNEVNPVSNIQDRPSVQRTKNMIVANGMNKNEAVDFLKGKFEGVPKEMLEALKPVGDCAKGNSKALFGRQSATALVNYAQEVRTVLRSRLGREASKRTVQILARAMTRLSSYTVPYAGQLLLSSDVGVLTWHLYKIYRDSDRLQQRVKEDLEAESWLYYPK